MFKMFNALDELFARTQENDELEWMDLLGNRSKCIFKWKPAIEPGKLMELFYMMMMMKIQVINYYLWKKP